MNTIAAKHIPTKQEVKHQVANSKVKSYKEAMNLFKEQGYTGEELKEIFTIIKEIAALQPKKNVPIPVAAPVVQPLKIRPFYVPSQKVNVQQAGKIFDLAVEAGATLWEGIQHYHTESQTQASNYDHKDHGYIGVFKSDNGGYKTYISSDDVCYSRNGQNAIKLNSVEEVEQYLRSGDPKPVVAVKATKPLVQKVKQKPVVSNKLLFTYATGQEFTVRGVTSAKVVVENDKTFVKYSAKRVGIEGFKTISEDVTIEVQGLIQVAYTNKDKNTQIVVFRDNKALSHIQAFDKTTPQTINL